MSGEGEVPTVDTGGSRDVTDGHDAAASRRTTRSTRTDGPRDDGGVFAPRTHGLTLAIGSSLAGHRPVIVAVVVWAIGFLVLGALITGLGFLVKDVLVPAGLGGVETGWSRWFVSERTSTLDTVTRFSSDLGSTLVVLGIAVATAVVLAIGKYWRQIAFLVCALTLEVGLFLLVGWVVGRHRPSVAHLDPAPPTSSFPSGHMASAMTLYVGLAIVALSIVRDTALRVAIWVLAIALPLLVGIARLYRGMHYPSDVTASILLSAGALVFALLAVRSMVAAAAERDRRHEKASRKAQSNPSPPEVTS